MSNEMRPGTLEFYRHQSDQLAQVAESWHHRADAMSRKIEAVAAEIQNWTDDGRPVTRSGLASSVVPRVKLRAWHDRLLSIARGEMK